MKQIICFLFSIFIFTSCSFISGSGNIVTESRPVNNFDEIVVGGSFEVEVRIGAVANVVVEADDNIMKYIKTTVSGKTLKIRTEDNHGFSNVHMKVLVTTPSLHSIKSSASADVVALDTLRTDGKLSFKASSSSSIQVYVDAPEIETDASSSATITLKGRTKNYDAQASSSADIKSFGLLSENTKARASSSGTVQVHASVSLDAKASSSGDIGYTGAAKVNSSVSSSGSVSKKD